jgi:hypothetical protein
VGLGGERLTRGGIGGGIESCVVLGGRGGAWKGWGLMRLSFGEGFIDFGSLLKSMVLLKDVIVVK